MYTDGLVERRGESIEEGIGVLGRTMAARPSDLGHGTLMSAISEAIGSPADDVALLLASIEPAASVRDRAAGRPDVLPGLRRRLRAWLGRRGFEDGSADVVLAVSEACNNAIEHAYREVEGTVRLRVAAEGNMLAYPDRRSRALARVRAERRARARDPADEQPDGQRRDRIERARAPPSPSSAAAGRSRKPPSQPGRLTPIRARRGHRRDSSGDPEALDAREGRGAGCLRKARLATLAQG